MKTTELMIGDWVMDGDKPAQISCILCDGVIETTATPWTNEEVVSPIPLTAEILEKNGIERSSYPGEITAAYFDDGKNHDIQLSVENGEVLWTIGFYEYVVLKLHYVHELQHALRLCELHELADNFKI